MSEENNEVNEEYRRYLVSSLFDASQKFYSEFRGRKVTDSTAPQRFRSIEDAGLVFQELWEEINSKATFEEGCLHVVEKYIPDVKIYKPTNDGVDHINIYSRGKTELGKLLSNFAFSIFEHPHHGKFTSVEGYWYYLKTGCLYYQELSGLYGFKAKAVGKKLEVVGHPDFDFQIELALWCKVMQNPYIKERLRESTLPFAHYYYYGNASNPAIRRVKNEQLQIVYEKIRKYLNKGRSAKKTTLVVLDDSFADYEFMNDKTTSGMRFFIHTPKGSITYVRSGKPKYADKPSFALRPGEKFIASATPQELFELSIEHDKVVYVGGRVTQSTVGIKEMISILHDVVSIGRF
jgi:hypothetical protein